MTYLANNGLTRDEDVMARHFLDRLDVVNHHHVVSVLSVVDNVASDYFQANFGLVSARLQGHFFAAYLIGGNLTKEGNRPDIDLLVATNMRYPDGYNSQDLEWLVKGLKTLSHFDLTIKSDLPDDYNLGETHGKGMIQLVPKSLWGGRTIDLVYIRSMNMVNTYCFENEDEFNERDIDKDGRPLPKLILYRSSLEIFGR
jgi:hypothetical protein